MTWDPKSDGLSNAPPTLERRPCVTTLHYSKWPLVINVTVGRMHKQQAPLRLALCQERGPFPLRIPVHYSRRISGAIGVEAPVINRDVELLKLDYLV